MMAIVGHHLGMMAALTAIVLVEDRGSSRHQMIVPVAAAFAVMAAAAALWRV
jgi:uncharacterized membrane protein YqjE